MSVGFGAILCPPIGTRLIDSVPPATIVSAKPHMMRSAPYAIACSPDEQKRFTVTADASTGMPARRLAIRATFMPCSASGIAQPRITSSTSRGSRPGARRRAASIAIAASSSGRVPCRAPLGAFPTGVRTAETITASFMPITQEVFNRVGDLAYFSIEQMIRAVYHDEFLRLGGSGVELADLTERRNLVALAVDEEFGLRRSSDGIEVIMGHRQRDPDHGRDARVGGAGGHRDIGPEGHPADPQPRARIPIVHEIERRSKVIQLAGTVRKRSLARSGA